MQDGRGRAMADYWQPVIEAAVKSKLEDFGSVKLRFVRNSSLKDEITFQNFLEKTIKYPLDQSRIFQKFSGKELLEEPISYAGVICPECHRAHGKTFIENKPGRSISWRASLGGIRWPWPRGRIHIRASDFRGFRVIWKGSFAGNNIFLFLVWRRFSW